MTRGGDARHILVVQALRAFVYGLGSVLIGVTLADLGLSGLQVGLVLSALIAGTAIVSVILARSGDQIGRRRWYVGLLALMALSGTVFALTDSVWLLVLVALTGTVSTEVVESGPFTSLEQAMLPNAAEGHDPTRLFGTYNTIATLAGSLGALAAIATRWVNVEPQRFLFAYPAAAGAAILVAAGLSKAVEAQTAATAAPRRPLEKSRGIVARLSGLFALTRSAAASSLKPSWRTGSRRNGAPRRRRSASSSSPSACFKQARSRSPSGSPVASDC